MPVQNARPGRALVAAALIFIPLLSAADPASERVDGFKASKRALARIEEAMAQGDRVTVAEQARLLAAFAEKIPGLYPVGAKGGFLSLARDDIWKNFPDFTEKAAAFQAGARKLEQAATAERAEAAQMSERLRQVKSACMSCHQSYKRGRP